MSRCRSVLPDLMTVRAVMVRAAMEEKKKGEKKGKKKCGSRGIAEYCRGSSCPTSSREWSLSVCLEPVVCL